MYADTRRFHCYSSALMCVGGFSICIVMIALWSPSSVVAHLAFYFTSCVVVLAFWHLQQLPILLSVLLVVIKSGIGTQREVG